MLGFKLDESIVFIPFCSEFPTTRIDLPTTLKAQGLAWRAMRVGMSGYARPAPPSKSSASPPTGKRSDRVGLEFGKQLDTIGVDSHLVLRAGDTRWADLVTKNVDKVPTCVQDVQECNAYFLGYAFGSLERIENCTQPVDRRPHPF